MKKVIILMMLVFIAYAFNCSKDKAVNEAPITLNFISQYPADGADSIPLKPTLTWDHDNPDNIVNYYDLYFGTRSDPPLIQPDIYENYYERSGLHDSTTYYWKIIARDRDQNEYMGPIWSFSTYNGPPTLPVNPYPPNDTIIPPIEIDFSWESEDLDGDGDYFDFYFGTTEDPEIFRPDLVHPWINAIQPVNFTDYYWKIVAKDSVGNEITGDLWHFRTDNFAPSTPSNPFPADAANDMSRNFTFSWQSEDTEDDTLSHDLYFGTAANPALEMNNIDSSVFLSTWQKVALAEQALLAIYDGQIEYRSGNNTYTLNGVPASAGAPNRYSTIGVIIDSTDVYTYAMVATSGTFSCTATANLDSDAAIDTRMIDETGVLVNTVNDLNTAFTPSTTYYWKIVAKDTYNDSTIGPVWQFTTGTE